MRVCMLTYSYYKTDARVRRYAETLAQRGDEVDVFAISNERQDDHLNLRGVNLNILQIREESEKGKISYLIGILKFFFKSMFTLTVQHLKKPYHVIHVHNPPEFLVFAATIPKLLGAKIIIDIHDILPELYALKFSMPQKGFAFGLLKLVEKVSIAFSNHMIVSNHLWKNTLLSRSVKEEKCTVMLNYPDDSVFHSRPRKRLNGKFIMIYPGSWIWLQGIDIAIKAFSIIENQVPMAEFHLYGGGIEHGSLEKLVSDLNLQNKVIFKNGVPTAEMAEIMANADLGIAPTRDFGFANEALSTKIMEFMAVGIPAIVSDTKVHRYYFNDNILKFFKAGDENNLAESMLLLIRDKDLRNRLVTKASGFIEDYIWRNRKGEYINIVDSLIHSRS